MAQDRLRFAQGKRTGRGHQKEPLGSGGRIELKGMGSIKFLPHRHRGIPLFGHMARHAALAVDGKQGRIALLAGKQRRLQQRARRGRVVVAQGDGCLGAFDAMDPQAQRPALGAHSIVRRFQLGHDSFRHSCRTGLPIRLCKSWHSRNGRNRTRARSGRCVPCFCGCRRHFGRRDREEAHRQAPQGKDGTWNAPARPAPCGAGTILGRGLEPLSQRPGQEGGRNARKEFCIVLR